MRLTIIATLLLIQVVGCFAGEVRVTDRIVPLVQDGGGWTTTITLVNLERTPARFELLLRTRLQQTWLLPVSGADVQSAEGYVRGTLPANGSVSFRTAGGAETLERGYAVLFSLDQAKIGVTTTVQQPSTATSLAIPLVPEREDRLTIPFDNTGGSSAILVWLSETPYAMVEYTALASDGKEIMSGTYQFSAEELTSQEVFLLADRFPQLKDRKGTLNMQVTYPGAGIYDELFFSAFAIQSVPGGAAFAVGSMAGATWTASRH
jgi:hypothetical protein